MKTLYILGNGFDLAHGLPTSYKYFQKFLSKREFSSAEDFAYVLEESVRSIDLWKDFEGAMGAVAPQIYIKHIMHEYADEQQKDNLRAQADAAYAAIEYIEKEKYENLIDAFGSWTRDIETNSPEPIYPNLNNPDNYFFTFNYTSTLENVYGIPADKVKHIHGKADDKDSQIVVGHNHDYAKDRNKINEALDLYLPADAGDSRDKIIELLNQSIKKTDDIIHENRNYFECLSQLGIQEIIVQGHSFGEVDYPYFRKIRDACPNAHWILRYYSCCDYIRAHTIMRSLALHATLEKA